MTRILQHIAVSIKNSADERGATAIEYGMIVAFIGAVIVLVVTALGNDVLEGFNKIEDALFGNDA